MLVQVNFATRVEVAMRLQEVPALCPLYPPTLLRGSIGDNEGDKSLPESLMLRLLTGAFSFLFFLAKLGSNIRMYPCVSRMYSYVTRTYPYVLICFSYVTRMLLICTRMYPYVTRMYSYVTRMYSYVTRMYSYVLVCFLYVTRVLPICYSYVLVCYSYVLVCYSYVLVCYSYVLVCYSYVLVCYSYVLVCYSYVLVCTRTVSRMSPVWCLSQDHFFWHKRIIRMVIRARTLNHLSPRAKNASRNTRSRHGTNVTSLITGKRNGECEVCQTSS